jgi:hypothetical protein
VTVAHIASKNIILPESFTQWGMISHTHKGNTVAHFAAEYGHLPDNFSQWELVNGEGVSIADVAKMSCGPTAELYAKWILRNEWPDVSEDHDTHGSHLL